MAKVFVSYSRKDSVVARKLIEGLRAIEQDVWVDWEDIPPAVDWLEQIFRGIEGSDVFIFLVSPDSIASEVCNVEVGRAALNNKRIVPIVLRDVDHKSTNEIIRKLNWIFLREIDVFDEAVQRVKTAIELDLPWVEEHNRLQLRALDWHRKKDVSLLLRGRDLRNAEQMIVLAVSKDPQPTLLQKTYLQHSLRSERNRLIAWIATGVALLMLSVLSYIAFYNAKQADLQRGIAQSNEARAVEQSIRADENAELAQEKAELARQAEGRARESENVAKAQRSAAKAQIYQSRPGELYTSTLLAIDSLQRLPSSLEAEEILRKNISLLPIPVEQMAQNDRINALEFSPNGETFVTASADGSACLWNLKDGEEFFCAPSSGSVNDAAFGPDGAIVATGDSSGEVLILDASTGEVQNKYNYGVPIWDVNISPNGESLAVARDDGRITFINLETRKFAFELSTFGSLYVSVFSPDGTWIAAGSSAGSVTLWNLKDRRILRGPVHKGEVFTLAFSPNGRLLVSGGADSTASVALTDTGKELFRVLNEDWVEDVAFSPDSSWFVTVSDDHRIRVWDSESGDERLRMLQDSFVTEVKVSSNGQWIATTGYDQTIRVWNAATGAELFQIPLEDIGSVLAFGKGDEYLVSGDQSGGINIWDISQMAAPVSYVQFAGFTTSVQFSPSDNWLAASDESRVWLLDEEQLSTLAVRPQGRPILEFKSNVQRLLISPDSNWIAILTDSGDLVLHSTESKSSRTMKLADPALSFAFSTDGLQLITAGTDGKVQVWDLASGESSGTLYEAETSVSSLAISQDFLAIGLPDKIMVLQLEDGNIPTEIESSGNPVLMAFNKDASLLASADTFGQIHVWKRAGDGFQLARSITSGQAFSMTFDPTGSRLLVGELDVLYLLDPLSGKEIGRIPHKDAVKDISFSADGAYLATSSGKVIQFWDAIKIPIFETDDLVTVACTRLIQNFDSGQWSALFGEEEYRVLCKDLP